MFRKFMSFFGRDELTEENVIKQIHNCLDMVFRGDYFAKKYVGVEAFQKRNDLKNAFIEYIENEMRRIVAADNPYREFREKIIKTIKVEVINGVLLREEFEYARDRIYETINRGIKAAEDNESFTPAMVLVTQAERFSDQPWGYTKLVHESTWAEVEGIVLRHLQVMVFERVRKDADWWNLYHQAYEKYVTDFYRLMIAKAEITEGFPHPMLAAMGNESLMHMEEVILNGVDK